MNILQHNYTHFKYYIEHIACVFTTSYSWENCTRNESLIMATIVTQVKRMRIESEEPYLELFGREDSDEELYIDDDVEGFAEIHKE